jgi:hypothetical protein
MKRGSGRRWFVVVGLVGLCTTYGFISASWVVFGQEAKPKPKPATPDAATEVHKGEPVSFWMKKKLDFSKNIMEGIALADFDKVTQNAQTLRGLSKIEAFVRRGTPGYRVQVDAFEQSLTEIIRQADKENLEGTTLGFHQLTVSCVKCHRDLRESSK